MDRTQATGTLSLRCGRWGGCLRTFREPAKAAAFVLYVIVYFPILASPRLDGKPG